MKIAVTGALGQLGGELCRQIGPHAIPLDIDTLDLTDGKAVLETLLPLKPEADYQLCRLYPGRQGRERTGIGPCRKCHGRGESSPRVPGTRLSTGADQHRLCFRRQKSATFSDYRLVAPENHPYREDDPPSPQGVYARTKLDGERAAAQHTKNILSCEPAGCTPGQAMIGRTILSKRCSAWEARKAKSGSLPINIARPAMFRTLLGRFCFLPDLINPSPRHGESITLPTPAQQPGTILPLEIFRQAGMNVAVKRHYNCRICRTRRPAVLQRPGHRRLSPSRRSAMPGLENGAGRVFY